ncbi:MAG: IclR family transcriptional regulator [Proteobacteria bacterium]|nr:IclR family transcriptional regulator [Pseudomonadota bacterium]
MRNADREDGTGAAARDPYLLESLRKGLEVIDCFARQESWSLAQLAGSLRQSKATIFRILHTLESVGYVAKDRQTGRYSLGMRFHTLGSAALRHEHLRWHSLAPLQDLAAATGETVHVGILYDGEAICVQAAQGTRLVRMHAFVGKRTAAHASALGKVLLAALPSDQAAAAVARRPFVRFTPSTIADLPALLAELDRVRAQGFALDDEEMEQGLRCLGVPIVDGTGRAAAALALSAPASRMDPARIGELLPQLREAASRIAAMVAGPAPSAARAA